MSRNQPIQPTQSISRFAALRSSIGGQIGLLIVFIIGLVTMLNVLTSSYLQRKSGEEYILNRAGAIGELAAAGSSGGIAFNDRDFLEKSMQGIERLSSFESLVIKNISGDTVYTKNYHKVSPALRVHKPLLAAADTTILSFNETGYAVAVSKVFPPINDENQEGHLGEVIVVLNTAAMNRGIERSQTGMLVASLAASVFCAMAAFFLVRRITRPIGDLSRVARRVSTGDLTQRAPKPKDDQMHGEVGVLTTAFNEMLDTLESSNEEMQATNLELAGLNHSLTLAKEETEQRAQELALANERIQAQNTELQELSQEKDEFLGIAAHDLKNPLSAIQGMSDMLVNERLEESDIKEMARMIRNSSVKMFELIRNLLDVNALERGGKQFQTTNINLTPLLSRIVDFYYKQAETKSITIHFDHNQPPAYILGDSMAVGQVLDNLVSNAVKYSPQGKNIFIRLQADTDTVRAEIQDEGPGISEEDKKKLFGKFARLSARPTGGEHSTGLGLSIVKKMVEAMNGRVWCESELGKGARFIAEFRAAETPNNAGEPLIADD